MSRCAAEHAHTLQQLGAQQLAALQVRLFHRAVVVANNQSGSMRGIVLQLGIDQFENEGRRVAAGVLIQLRMGVRMAWLVACCPVSMVKRPHIHKFRPCMFVCSGLCAAGRVYAAVALLHCQRAS